MSSTKSSSVYNIVLHIHVMYEHVAVIQCTCSFFPGFSHLNTDLTLKGKARIELLYEWLRNVPVFEYGHTCMYACTLQCFPKRE